MQLLMRVSTLTVYDGPMAVCPVNTFSPTAGSSTCTNCPAGTYTAGTNASSSFQCLACPPGTISLGLGDACAPCPVNTFANLGTLAGSTSCTNCVANTDTNGLTGQTACTGLCRPLAGNVSCVSHVVTDGRHM
jgi:hypothetical protein